MHGAKAKLCKSEGCTNNDLEGGLASSMTQRSSVRNAAANDVPVMLKTEGECKKHQVIREHYTSTIS